jgi:hypothetical protein
VHTSTSSARCDFIKENNIPQVVPKPFGDSPGPVLCSNGNEAFECWSADIFVIDAFLRQKTRCKPITRTPSRLMAFSEGHALPKSISVNCHVVYNLALQWIGYGQEVWRETLNDAVST